MEISPSRGARWSGMSRRGFAVLLPKSVSEVATWAWNGNWDEVGSGGEQV
jgi:hypothetical protein